MLNKGNTVRSYWKRDAFVSLNDPHRYMNGVFNKTLVSIPSYAKASIPNQTMRLTALGSRLRTLLWIWMLYSISFTFTWIKVVLLEVESQLLHLYELMWLWFSKGYSRWSILYRQQHGTLFSAWCTYISYTADLHDVLWCGSALATSCRPFLIISRLVAFIGVKPRTFWTENRKIVVTVLS